MNQIIESDIQTFDQFKKWIDSIKNSPYGKIKQRGSAGASGDWYRAEFELENGDTVYWDSEVGWENETEHEQRMKKERIESWNLSWQGLSETKREFILLIFPNLLEQDKSKMKSANNYVAFALHEAVRKSLIELEVCSRCGGDGHYSYNQMHGTMCYGCGGNGKSYPRITKKLIKQIKLFS